MKKEPKKEQPFSKDREFAVILEKIYSEFKVFGENQSALSNKVDMMFEELGKQAEDIFIIKADIRIIKNDIVEIKLRLSKVETDIAEIKATLKDHTKRITHLEAASPK